MLGLATTLIANPPTETKQTLRMSLQGMRQILAVSFTKVDLSASHIQSSLVGNQESGFALGSADKPATITFDLAIPADDDGSVLRTQLNRGRQILQFRAVEESPLDNGMASFSTWRGTGALVDGLRLSGKLGSMKGTLKITCDRIETAKTVAVASQK